MKTGILIVWLFFSLNTIESVEKKEKEIITIENQINIDGEIHKQNLINSVEDFLKEMNIDPDTIYVPFRDTM